MKQKKLLLFGGTGAIGSVIANYFRQEDWLVLIVTRQSTYVPQYIHWNPLDSTDATGLAQVLEHVPFDAVCWAQGANGKDSVYHFDANQHRALYEANVLFILSSIGALLQADTLTKPARLCIISSIWQNLARQDKLSYCVTKAALQGLVLSAANDLGRDGHLINAVLPGVTDTPMTHRNLSATQIETISNATQFHRLPTLEDVASAVFSLCSPKNTGVTGQFVAVDLGYSHGRVI